MKEPYLEITFRHGRPLAAYLYLPREDNEKSVRTEQAAPGLLIDFAAGGRPIGLEITAPGQVAAATINRVLADLGLSPLPDADLAPLRTAA
ncbi:MAG TPA: DUF2283 domain-containing protein [Thermoanaerobaculia bacterium]|nr:DUF2283 domain-containing protein [Thermoanaerobaculia bacterium]